ncbi:MAG: hypothetical protein ABI113_20205, partial [Mucilaginibacter sp.]
GEIKKIHLIDSEWALGFSRLTEFDIVNENNKWNCYQIKQKYTWDPLDKNKDYYAKQNSEQRKFVKKINAEAINGLFKTISTVKPAHNWKIYGITPVKVASTVDTVYLKKWEPKQPKAERQIFVNELKKPANIKAAIDSVQHYSWTDDYPVCAIEIIKRNNDTVKVYSNNQIDYTLPWMVNCASSYDLNINKFFADAMGDYRNSNHDRLTGTDFIYKIQEYIYDNFATEAIIRNKWSLAFPSQYKALSQGFEVGHMRYSNDGVSLFARSNQLPRAFTINAEMKMGDDTDLTELIHFKDSLAARVKKGNFVFNYYKDSPNATVSFGYRRHKVNDLAEYNEKFRVWQQKNIAVYNKDNMLLFSVEARNRDFEDWLLLPDNRLILLSYFYPKVAGVTDKRLEVGDDSRKDCFILFDNEGNLVSENP